MHENCNSDERDINLPQLLVFLQQVDDPSPVVHVVIGDGTVRRIDG